MPKPTRQGFTVIVVPTGGGGNVRQVEVSARQLQLGARAAVVAGTFFLVLAGASAWALPQATQAERLRAENARLREGFDSVESRLAHMESLASRLQAFDDRLRQLAADGVLIAGGPLEDDDAEAFSAWVEGNDGAPRLDWPAGEPPDRAQALVARSADVVASFDRVLEGLDALEAGQNLGPAFGCGQAVRTKAGPFSPFQAGCRCGPFFPSLGGGGHGLGPGSARNAPG